MRPGGRVSARQPRRGVRGQEAEHAGGSGAETGSRLGEHGSTRNSSDRGLACTMEREDSGAAAVHAWPRQEAGHAPQSSKPMGLPLSKRSRPTRPFLQFESREPERSARHWRFAQLQLCVLVTTGAFVYEEKSPDMIVARAGSTVVESALKVVSAEVKTATSSAKAEQRPRVGPRQLQH